MMTHVTIGSKWCKLNFETAISLHLNIRYLVAHNNIDLGNRKKSNRSDSINSLPKKGWPDSCGIAQRKNGWTENSTNHKVTTEMFVGKGVLSTRRYWLAWMPCIFGQTNGAWRNWMLNVSTMSKHLYAFSGRKTRLTRRIIFHLPIICGTQAATMWQHKFQIFYCKENWAP